MQAIGFKGAAWDAANSLLKRGGTSVGDTEENGVRAGG